MFSRWRRPPEPPPRKWFQQPAVVLTMVAMFVLGPVGVIWNGMTEELKIMRAEDKENKGAIIQNQLAIKELLTRQQMLLMPSKGVLQRTGKADSFNFKKSAPKKLTPEEYAQYIKMNTQQQQAYRTYRTDVTLWP